MDRAHKHSFITCDVAIAKDSIECKKDRRREAPSLDAQGLQDRKDLFRRGTFYCVPGNGRAFQSRLWQLACGPPPSRDRSAMSVWWRELARPQSRER